VLVAADDEVDENALYKVTMLYDNNACMMTRCVPARRVLHDTPSNGIDDELNRARVLTSPTEVIVDNAASRSVFFIKWKN
jgi:hypothetical protein